MLQATIAALPMELVNAPLPYCRGTKAGSPLLLWAVRSGNEAAVRLLLARGADPNVTCNPKCAAALMSASFEGHVEIARLLLAAKAHVDRTNHHGYTPLIVAAMQGHAAIVDVLVEAGAWLDHTMKVEEGKATAILAASQQGHTPCVRRLIASRASTNLPNANGDVPLGAAAYKGHRETVAALLVVSEIEVDYPNQRGATPLGLACFRGHVECAALLLAHGAFIDHAAHDTRTAMYAACRLGHMACAQLLSSYGAARVGIARAQSPDPTTAEDTALHFGFINLENWLRQSRGWSPLHHLEQLTHARARALLRAGARLHARPHGSPKGPTPVERAVALVPPLPASTLLIAAAQPWSPHNHHLFPAIARARAVDLLLLGHALCAEPRFLGEAQSLLDCWLHIMMPRAVTRELL